MGSNDYIDIVLSTNGSENHIDFEQVKARHPLAEYCEQHGVHLRRNGATQVACCPVHDEKTPSFHVYPDNHFHCFGCDVRGDVIDLDQRLYGGSNTDAVKRLMGEIPTTSALIQKPARKPAASEPYSISKDEMQECVQALGRLAENPNTLAKWRNWNPETIRGLALDGHLGLSDQGLPAFVFNTGMKVRTMETGKDKKVWHEFGESTLWRGDFVTNATKRIIVAEGEIDAITLIDSGIEADGETAVVALPGATFNIEGSLEQFQDKSVVLVGDADAAGYSALKKITKRLRSIASEIYWTKLHLDDSTREIKDLTDLRDAREGLTAVEIEKRFYRTDNIYKNIAKWAVRKFGASVLPEGDIVPLIGHSLLDFSEMDVDWSQNLLGFRWLERTNVAGIVAPSGQGKSTLSIQAAIEWSCGRQSFFGVKPAGPLRILVVQAEDNVNDCASMARVARRLNLTGAEKELVRRNTLLERVNNASGAKFCALVDNYCAEFKPDLVIINPLTSYLGGDDKKDDLVSEFRDELNAVLSRHKCGAIIIAHTPKTNYSKTDEYTRSDWQYRIAGCAMLTNWFRALLVLKPEDEYGLYCFIAAKRDAKIGWEHGVWKRYFRWSSDPDALKWEEAEAPAVTITVGKGKSAPVFREEEYLKHISLLDSTLKSEVELKIREAMGHGEKYVKQRLQELEQNGKIFTWVLPRTSKRGRAPEGWCRREQTEVMEGEVAVDAQPTEATADDSGFE